MIVWLIIFITLVVIGGLIREIKGDEWRYRGIVWVGQLIAAAAAIATLIYLDV